MPFGLKNAITTYHRLINKMSATLLGKTMETYTGDMVVNSKKECNHIQDLD